MSVAADKIRNRQRIIWDKFAAGWKKWDAELLDWQRPFGAAVIQGAGLRLDSTVLDVASGTGEPGLTAAALVPGGGVELTDISAGMLQVAQEKASTLGMGNVRFRVCDAAELPFDDGTFDAVLCCFGLMFFPDMRAALREMVRTAKPGARISAAVWGRAAANPWASLVLGTLAQHTELPAPPADMPGLFRCSAPGFMTRLFRGVGLLAVQERTVSTDLVHDSPASYWEFMTDIATTVATGLALADEEARSLIRSDVFQMLGRYEHGGLLRLRSTATIVTGIRA
ncbi:methyltransferase domain-containing protein [Arthrobacter sp. UKPF54-2]|uniref:class I SAM-dependent methyltransferase n=1 Tax=Arthrobacter sp. UKPF54-2 TaxID=2600159 RepID=UPI0011B1972C|nr:methyltransferase domain-containing protein [Arthrobacter sp. UKPF54-2]QDY89988.1 methyltransferase domain-containing protein [Arthrobacter sp. UKPF54-2]